MYNTRFVHYITEGRGHINSLYSADFGRDTEFGVAICAKPCIVSDIPSVSCPLLVVNIYWGLIWRTELRLGPTREVAERGLVHQLLRIVFRVRLGSSRSEKTCGRCRMTTGLPRGGCMTEKLYNTLLELQEHTIQPCHTTQKLSVRR